MDADNCGMCLECAKGNYSNCTSFPQNSITLEFKDGNSHFPEDETEIVFTKKGSNRISVGFYFKNKTFHGAKFKKFVWELANDYDGGPGPTVLLSDTRWAYREKDPL